MPVRTAPRAAVMISAIGLNPSRTGAIIIAVPMNNSRTPWAGRVRRVPRDIAPAMVPAHTRNQCDVCHVRRIDGRPGDVPFHGK